MFWILRLDPTKEKIFLISEGNLNKYVILSIFRMNTSKFVCEQSDDRP